MMMGISLTHQASRWQYRGTNAPDVALPPAFVDVVGGSPLVARLLWNRGIQTIEQAKAFLAPAVLESLMPVEALPDGDLAVERIQTAIENQEAILIFGDFDVDGMTGTSIFYETLKRLGAKVSFYIPDRANEGHGLNATALVRLVSTRGLKLVITTDTGISNFNEISLLKSLNVDTVVTDHHELPENLPPSVANCNPQRLPDVDTHPLGVLSGAGVAFKVCQALYDNLLPPEEALEATEQLLDLCAIGLIADMVPLRGENRPLVQLGLQQLQKRHRLGIAHVLEQAGVAPEAVLNAETVGFTIGPRLNALGRLDNATESVELLTTSDPERAKSLAIRLETLNKKRQELCEKTFIEAEQHLQATGGIEGRKAIILASPQWNPGIIGIVASRLIEKYRLPTFMMVIEQAENKARCSARSIKGFHLTEQLEKLKHYFLNFGGHAGAAGFALSAEKLVPFKEDLWKLAGNVLTEEDIRPIVEVDCNLSFAQLNLGMLDLLANLQPFGMENPSPLFVLENMQVAAQRPLGESGNHLKLMLKPAPNSHTAVKGELAHVEALVWKCGADFRLDPTETYHFVVTIEKNGYERGTPVQAIVKDVKLANQKIATVHETVQQHQQATEKAPEKALGLTPETAIAGTKMSTENGKFSSNGASLVWVDHRNRPNLREYASQLLLPSPENTGSTLLYSEGKAPNIPLLDPQSIVSRDSLRSADALLLWDVPPSQEAFAQLLKGVSPKTVHVLGGKYQEVPVRLPLAMFLKGFYQGLAVLTQGNPTGTIDLTTLESRFATVRTVVLLGLGLLQQLGCLEATVLTEAVTLSLKQPPANADLEASTFTGNPLVQAFLALQEDVSVFRQQVLALPASQDFSVLLR